jgi:hypothetical protein
MRKLITGMKISLDGKMEGPEDTADWVEAWSDDYGLMPHVDACVLGAGMYPGYEWYWTAIQKEPDKPVWITGSPPKPAEIEWARFAAQTPHYVLSSTLNSALWPNTSFVRGLDEIVALKRQPGKDIYLMGVLKQPPAFSMPGWSTTSARCLSADRRYRKGALCHHGTPSCTRTQEGSAASRRSRQHVLPNRVVDRIDRVDERGVDDLTRTCARPAS